MVEKISDLVKYDNKGYILEVDVEYPANLHNQHKDLLLMPERMKINGVEKLVPNLSDKHKYRALDQALRDGLILNKVHRVIQFDQLAWLKSYIDFNTKHRAKTRNDFEKDFFKLMNNVVFGKTMENIRNHRNIKLATT